MRMKQNTFILLLMKRRPILFMGHQVENFTIDRKPYEQNNSLFVVFVKEKHPTNFQHDVKEFKC